MVVQSRFTEKGNCTSERQACHPRKGESHPDTGKGLLPCIFTAHESGPCPIARTPEDPLVQDSLSYHTTLVRKVLSLTYEVL